MRGIPPSGKKVNLNGRYGKPGQNIREFLEKHPGDLGETSGSFLGNLRLARAIFRRQSAYNKSLPLKKFFSLIRFSQPEKTRLSLS